LAALLVSMFGTNTTQVNTRSSRSNKRRSREETTQLCGFTKNMESKIQDLCQRGFLVPGCDNDRRFLNFLGTPSVFNNRDLDSQMCKDLVALGMSTERANQLLNACSEIVASQKLFEQTTKHTVFGSERMLLDGSFNTQHKWHESGFSLDFKRQGFKPGTLDRLARNNFSLKLGDGRDLRFSASTRKKFPDGPLKIYEGKFRLKSTGIAPRTSSMGVILSQHAIDNGSEPARLVLGVENRKKRNPVFVQTAFHMRPSIDLVDQLVRGDLYANLVAFEIDMASNQLWSIQAAHIPLYAYVDFCGAGKAMAVSATIIANVLGIEQELSEWLEDCEHKISMYGFQSGFGGL